MEAWRLKMELWPWRVYRPVVAGYHHFDEEQYPDPICIKVEAGPEFGSALK
jgi:hypothetical protein